MSSDPGGVLVLGSTGFVGRAVAHALAAAGYAVREVHAPRLVTRARTFADLNRDLVSDHHGTVDNLAGELHNVEVVVNAAGVATAESTNDDAMFGANALMPLALTRAAQEANISRVVHVSSAAVQGRMAVLDESTNVKPFSVYSQSKALGEQALLGSDRVIIVRPTSVHGSSRSITRRIVSLAHSPFGCVAGRGEDPTPQAHIRNTAEVIAQVASLEHDPPSIVLQPYEGFSTRSFLQLMGEREPCRLPVKLTTVAINCAWTAARGGYLASQIRRAELLLRGQPQVEGWYAGQDLPMPAGVDDWLRLVQEVRGGV